MFTSFGIPSDFALEFPEQSPGVPIRVPGIVESVLCAWVPGLGFGSNEYPQSMFWSKNKKNRYTPAYPSFTI